MIATALTMLLLTAEPDAKPADEYVSFKVMPVQLSVPSAWTHSVDEGSHHFTSPEGDAFFNVDVGKVQTEGMKAQTCVDKITKAVGGKFKKGTYGDQPGAMQSSTDKGEDGKEVVTRTYVGCDGKTTWSVTFHYLKTRASTFAPVAEKVTSSVAYLKGK